MRFIAGGPEIPDELLVARDAGDVVFFCGAGVSRARAHRPDFFTLGRNVIQQLGAGDDGPAARLLARIEEIGDKGRMPGVGGLIATDQIFSLLEREFETADIRSAVAVALRRDEEPDLSAHRTLRDLSRSRDGTVRLVTTNFDLLFEACDPDLACFGPPNLPDPRSDRFKGVVHLHGRVNTAYTGIPADDEEFVLSRADFGRAYLSDGWATRFIQSLLERFQIVFVGYSADDPPIQYLLEALNLKAGSRTRLFAFQGGSGTDAQALWEHRGVQAIPFDESEGFESLWNTLDAWAERARDTDGWYASVFRSASAGPDAVDAHIRGQIAHVFSTQEGARRIAVSDPPLPAAWLLSLDPALRYDSPGPVDPDNQASKRIDPYERLGLDWDTPPEPVKNEQFRSERVTPPGAWDAFAPTRADQDAAAENSKLAFRGYDSVSPAILSDRLRRIGIWLGRVAHEPITLWWSGGQNSLHPDIVRQIEHRLRQDVAAFPEDVRRGWRMLFRVWSDTRDAPERLRYEIEHRVGQDGWEMSHLRDYVALYRPRLKVHRPYGILHPLSWTSAERPTPVLAFDVDYPRPHDPLPIPEDHLAYAATLFRADLELAKAMEREVTGHDTLHFETTRVDVDSDLEDSVYGLTGPILRYQRLMQRLAEVNLPEARAEMSRWPHDKGVFARLRIWASGSSITTPGEALAILLELPDDVFWKPSQQRDLLFVIRDRWPEFSKEQRAALEERLRTGSYPWPEDVRSGTTDAAAHYRLDRFEWLSRQGIAFSFDLSAEMATLRTRAPDWTSISGKHAADSNLPVVHTIETDTRPDGLLDAPIGEIIAEGRKVGERDFFTYTERRPFLGLAAAKPARAFGALAHAARRSETPTAEWSGFLGAEKRKSDPVRMVRAIGALLERLPIDHLRSIAYPVAQWMKALDGRLYADAADVLPTLWRRVIEALSIQGDDRDRPVDSSWANDALNAPVGKLADVVLKDPTTEGLARDVGLPEPFKARFEQLLALPGDMRRHALVMIGAQTTWLFAIDPTWTETNLLSCADDEGTDGDALWDGILWAARAPSRVLFERLKSGLLKRALGRTRRRAEGAILAGFLLIGWGGGAPVNGSDPLISSRELRQILIKADDELRAQVLWHLWKWSQETNAPWRNRILTFLREVWPIQRMVRTQAISERLADLALVGGDLFPEIVSAIVPRMVPIRNGSLGGLMLRHEQDDHPARRFPSATLDLLWAVLAEDPAFWPYKVEVVIEMLSEAPETRADPRLSELRRRRA